MLALKTMLCSLFITFSFYGIGPKTKNQLYHHKYATNETFTYYLQHEEVYESYLKDKQQQATEYHENPDMEYGNIFRT